MAKTDDQVKNFVVTTQTGFVKILSCGLIDGDAVAQTALNAMDTQYIACWSVSSCKSWH